MITSQNQKALFAVLLYLGSTQSTKIFAMERAATAPAAVLEAVPVELISQLAQERAAIVIAMLTMIAKDQFKEVPVLYQKIQRIEHDVFTLLEPILKKPSHEGYQAALSKLRVYATVQLNCLIPSIAREINSEHIDPLLTARKKNYVDEQLAADDTALTAEEIDKLTSDVVKQSQWIPEIRRDTEKKELISSWYAVLRQRLLDIQKINNYPTYSSSKTPLMEKLEIDENFTHPELTNLKALEKHALFVEGGELATAMIAKFVKYIEGDDKKSQEMSEKMIVRMGEIAHGPVNDALLFFKGFQENLKLLSISAEVKDIHDEKRVANAIGMYDAWRNLAKDITHAQTQDQLLYCYGKGIMDLAFL